MKKILLVALLALLPMSVYALEPMSMDSLDEITAQEGVKISIGGGDSDHALIITQQSVSTAWENNQGTTTDPVKSSILMNVTGGTDTIKIWGDLTIQAKKVTVNTELVDAVVIGLPQITKQVTKPTTTVISIGGAITPVAATATEAAYLGQGDSKILGSLYQTGGLTTVNTATGSVGTITITAM